MIKTVQFIPIKQGDILEVGDMGLFGITGKNKLVGFKPGPAGKRQGWLVILVDEESKERPHHKRPLERIKANDGR
jgi:hypothetical protein